MDTLWNEGEEVPPELPPIETKFYIERPVVVKFTDMADKMRRQVLSLTHRALTMYYDEADLAMYIKTHLDNIYPGGKWQVVVGRNVGLSCCYEQGKYIYFYVGHTAYIVYRTGAF